MRYGAKTTSLLVALGIFFTAAVLRSPLTSLGALSLSIQSDLGLGAGAMGLVTTLPLLVFAASAVAVSAVSDRIGKKRTLAWGMALVAVGVLVRSYVGDVGLFAGTVMLGAGISTGNVLLPAVVKESFPLRIGAMTALYTTTMSIFAGGFAGTASVLADASMGWRTVLALIAPLAIVAVAFWVVSKGGGVPARDAVSDAQRREAGRLFHPRIVGSPLTWWVTGLFGLQSVLFYCSVAWLPAMLAARGISGGAIALCVALFPIMGMPCTMFLPPLAQRMRSQRALGAVVGACCAGGMALLAWAPTDGWAVFATAFYGLALGAPFCLCMFYFGFRTENAADAARLSSVAQTFGYLMAAMGPACLGALFDATLSWDLPLAVLFVLACGIALCGWKAGRGKIAR